MSNSRGSEISNSRGISDFASEISRYFIGFLYDLLFFPILFYVRIYKWMHPENVDNTLYKNKKRSRNAIILVHGSGTHELQFILARRHLHKLYGGAVYSIDLHTNKTDRIERYAMRLSSKVNEISLLYDSITLVGHSMGGLVCGYFLVKYQNVSKIKNLVTICSPWKGAPLLEYLHFLPCLKTERHLQMTPNSHFLQDLEREFHCRREIQECHIICVGSKRDIQVPLKYAILDNCDVIVKNYGHTSIIMFQDTWREIIAKLHV
jgi:predicted alpha/beta hydrolase family esterase